MSPVLCLVGGIHLIGCRVEELPHQLRLGHLEQKTVLDGGVDLEGVAEADLLLAQAGPLGRRPR